MDEDIKKIEVIGNFLRYYASNLEYIKQFYRFKNNEIAKEDYLNKKEEGNFLQFLTEFKIVRRIEKRKNKKDNRMELLKLTIKWVKGSNSNNVDKFVKKLNDEGITNGNEISLASKVLFLNNPWDIIPCDSQAKKSVGYKGKCYKEYLEKINQGKQRIVKDYSKLMKLVQPLIKEIEKNYKGIEELNQIRENRLVDLHHWTSGKK